MIDPILLALGLMATAIYLVYLAIKIGQPNAKRNKKLSKVNYQTSRKLQVSGRDWDQLVAKCHGDKAIAQRLINHLRVKHPGHSGRWYVEKAIFDIERDKGRY